MSSYDADHCDKCNRALPCCRLDLGGGAGVYLCRPCWATEMQWRRERNSSILHPVAYKFDIIGWPGDHA